MKDRLMEIITVAITRCCVKCECGMKIDEASVIADALIENGITMPVKE